ncbi:WD40-repeat-containing domain protein [Dipodascopsis tothii]|uniref:WD40-repeat-containing domain protein n=1 Tax=Dipodascopsis tothii TaxID=44089 RepID=UPI0034CD8D1C
MSITRGTIWAGLPTTTRGRPTHLSYDPRTQRLVYACHRSVVTLAVADGAATLYGGHTAAVTVAKFSPSGYYIASGDASGTLKVFDATAAVDPVTKGSYAVLAGPIADLAWDADSARVGAVGAGRETFGAFVTMDSGNSVGEVSGHSAAANAVAIRPVRPYRAASVDDDGALVFYTGPPFKFSSGVRGKHTNFVHDVAFQPAPAAAVLVSVGADRRAVVYDGKTGEVRFTVDAAHAAGVYAVAFARDDASQFATAGGDGVVRLWQLDADGAAATAAHTWTIGTRTVEDQQVGLVALDAATGYAFAALGLDGTLHYLARGGAGPAKSVYGHQKGITALAVAGDRVLTGSYDGRVLEWSADGVAAPAPVQHSNLVAGLAVVGGDVVSVGWDDTLRTAAGETALGAQPTAVASTAAAVYVLCADDTLKTYAAGSLSSAPVPAALAAAAVSTADGDLLAFASPSTVSVYAAGKLDAPVHTFAGPRSTPSVLAFSPSGTKLAVGDTSGKVALYSLAPGAVGTVLTTRWVFNTAKITAIDWLADESHVAVASLDTNIIVYAAADGKYGKNAKMLGAHKDGCTAVRFVDGGKRLVSVGADAAVKWWDVTLP